MVLDWTLLRKDGVTIEWVVCRALERDGTGDANFRKIRHQLHSRDTCRSQSISSVSYGKRESV